MRAVLRVFDGLVRLMNAIGSLWIMLIMILINIDVIGRYVFNSPVRGVPLVITMSLIAIVFLQLSDALLAGRVTRNEALLGRFLRDRPKLGHTLQAIYHAAGILLMVLLIWFSVPMFDKAWKSEAYLGNRGDFILPEWPFKLLIVVGSIVVALQFVRLTWLDVRVLRGKSVEGLGVAEARGLE
ncbi:MAG TPA: TRAP transporter small permease subunit [Alphaproteobacteria bacterium]